jgi:hypothetical protein
MKHKIILEPLNISFIRRNQPEYPIQVPLPPHPIYNPGPRENMEKKKYNSNQRERN